jgi:uncharacterized protein YqjF (DUF2071 family)
MRMRWRELLFAHWVLDSESTRRLRAFVPRGLKLDLFEGACYVGAVPFLMENTGPRFVPPIPGLHAFPELNLRTYVVRENKPGVWFFSLDAGSKLAVRTARRFFHLPYFDAKFEVETNGAISYRAIRTHRGATPAAFDATYRPVGDIYRANAGSLDDWLTARYCLYSIPRIGPATSIDAKSITIRGRCSAPKPISARTLWAIGSASRCAASPRLCTSRARWMCAPG